jgi:hypothetical protein
VKFAPGQSGNPGGRPRVVTEVRDLARLYMPLAIKTLADIAQNGRQDAARVAAATALLDRAYGRPTQPISGDAEMPPLALSIQEKQRRTREILDQAFGADGTPQNMIVRAGEIRSENRAPSVRRDGK